MYICIPLLYKRYNLQNLRLPCLCFIFKICWLKKVNHLIAIFVKLCLIFCFYLLCYSSIRLFSNFFFIFSFVFLFLLCDLGSRFYVCVVSGNRMNSKAFTCEISRIVIGYWTRIATYPEDLLAKCYFKHNKKLIWEILELNLETGRRLKKKMEMIGMMYCLIERCPITEPESWTYR